jgi:membrane protein implicated in regulation of membrane protease activity
MFEQLLNETSESAGPLHFLLGVALSVLVSVIVIGLYRMFYSRPGMGSDMQRAFLLLGPSITALFMVIQFSIPMSLGLFGVFAIIRFRNPVRDPEEIGFLMLLLASAVICATLQVLQLVIFLLLVTVALMVRRRLQKSRRKAHGSGLYVLNLSPGESDDLEASVIEVLEARVPNADIQSISYAEGFMTVHCRFAGAGAPSAAELTRILAGVAPVRQIDVFYAEPNGSG